MHKWACEHDHRTVGSTQHPRRSIGHRSDGRDTHQRITPRPHGLEEIGLLPHHPFGHPGGASGVHKHHVGTASAPGAPWRIDPFAGRNTLVRGGPFRTGVADRVPTFDMFEAIS